MTHSRRTLVTVLVALLFGALFTAAPAAAEEGPRVHEGTIDGADFLVKVPKRWNGTLVLYSHGLYVEQWGKPAQIMLATRPETETWLLDQGYALAASNYKGVYGHAIEEALTDQIALLDWFQTTVGKPRRTVTSGMSMGAVISLKLAEDNPGRFDGVLAQCGEYDVNGTWNSALDILFALKTLLAPDADIDLVRPRDPQAAQAALEAVVAEAQKTEAGRARIALAGALGTIPGWALAHEPEPTAPADRLAQQALWVSGAYLYGYGPGARPEIEHRAGGNPSFNTGIDYRSQLARSSGLDLVRHAYRAGGVDLQADLDRLAAAPRISADPKAQAYLHRYTVARGTTPSPVLTAHTTGDGGAVAGQARWYGDQVRRNGDPTLLRQTYVSRGGHCSFNAAEEIVLLRTLLSRADTGRWPSTDPRRLTAAATALGPGYRLVRELFDPEGKEKAMAPLFTRFTPPAQPRPSR
ncbi:alpha/beta hydrolase family protein [Amycolatopsis sp. NPDC052450]|uniref:alpha/beta hydrolase family protein n=1 Tax=Amycolatopsis sp. NPDC052450 TaxID=3363937 RepID=UPI0037C80585